MHLNDSQSLALIIYDLVRKDGKVVLKATVALEPNVPCGESQEEGANFDAEGEGPLGDPSLGQGFFIETQFGVGFAHLLAHQLWG